MKAGYLSQFFSGIAIKKLSAVEADPKRSNQHEFNGVAGLKRVFGLARKTYQARFIYLSDNDDDPVVADGTLTWYDSRENRRPRTEHRMYFPTTTVSLCAAEGDILVIGKRPDDSVLVVIAQGESTIANQILWLFHVRTPDSGHFSVLEELETEQDRIQFASQFILEQIGIPVETSAEIYLDQMLKKFGRSFPETRFFSEFARSTVKDMDMLRDPDAAVMAWMEREEVLFRTLEKHFIAERLTKGFHDVEEFLQYSLSVQNRRKSRAGFALENHMEVVFSVGNVRYTREAKTEGHSRPDFLFPGVREYHDPSFDSVLLTMLGVKSTCKDRWRQVLAEAHKIKNKHLLTLEAAISNNQTDAMRSEALQLVVPRGLHKTYSPAQQSWLMDIASFVAMVRERQKLAGIQ